MISGTNKTIALNASLNLVGIDLRGTSYHPSWMEESVVQGLVDAFSLTDAKTWWVARVYEIAKAKRDQVVQNYSTGEMAAWSVKEKEAGQYVSELTASTTCPMLYMEAQARGTSVEAIKTRVLANAAAFRAVEAGISGHAGKLRDQIMAAADFAAIEGININADWPL